MHNCIVLRQQQDISRGKRVNDGSNRDDEGIFLVKEPPWKETNISSWV